MCLGSGATLPRILPIHFTNVDPVSILEKIIGYVVVDL